VLCVEITFWTLAYILTSDSILQQVKTEIDDVVSVDSKSRYLHFLLQQLYTRASFPWFLLFNCNFHFLILIDKLYVMN